ncbi:MAG: DUF3108 domain-containing protein [Alphaproteobacteria bacterium]|nr:DUF3108 domain-containing protein [Alphaproteobacteria bacterium]
MARPSKHRVFLSVSLVITAMMISPQSTTAESKNKDFLLQKMNFDVYAGGLHAVKANMTLDYSQYGRYKIFFEAETRGLLGSLAPWSGSFESTGWVMGQDKRQPELHESIAIWRDEKEVKSYNYKRNGTFKNLVTQYTHKKPRVEEPDPELTKNTTDALTATILVLEKVANSGECEGSSAVFDGKRRYELIFRHQRQVMLERTRYNAYSGPAIECTVEVVPIAGAWHKKPRGWLSIQEQGRDRGMMPTVWIAQVTPYAVAVPVRVRVRTAYGTMFMHMSRYQSGHDVIEASYQK